MNKKKHAQEQGMSMYMSYLWQHNSNAPRREGGDTFDKDDYKIRVQQEKITGNKM